MFVHLKCDIISGLYQIVNFFQNCNSNIELFTFVLHYFAIVFALNHFAFFVGLVNCLWLLLIVISSKENFSVSPKMGDNLEER